MKSVCFVSGSSPDFLGGVSLYQRNLINYSRNKRIPLEFTWVYAGEKNKRYSFEGINCIEIKCSEYPLLKDFDFARKVGKIIEANSFDILNTHANWGYFLKKYKRKSHQKITHTYHGVTYPYMKVQFARFGVFKYLFYPILPFVYLLEKPPLKKADNIICVSNKVKEGLFNLYNIKKDFFVIRTGADLSLFKKLPKDKSRKELRLEEERIYGLYSGRGGYWNKGLDRAIKLSSEMYKLNKDYRLIIIGSDKNKCKRYLNKPFVIYKGLIRRKELPKYYSSADFFFFLSRSEGGAPTLALSEAIACECFSICSKDSQPEIFENKKDCLIIDNYSANSAQHILKILESKREIDKMKKSSKQKIKELSLEKWGDKYFGVLLK